MQQKRHWRGTSPVSLLAAATAAALAGCASDHYLGDLPGDVSSGSAEDSSTGAASGPGDLTDGSVEKSREDFTIDPVLEPPDVHAPDENVLDFFEGRRRELVAAVGDVDGDGLADFATTGDADAGWGVAQGYVHLRYGAPRRQGLDGAFALLQGGVRLTKNSDAYLQIEGLTAAGDVDGDGLADFLVAIGGGNCRPRLGDEGVYLVYGRGERFRDSVESLSDVAVLLSSTHLVGTETANCPNGTWGTPLIAAAGDMDGDGLDDFIVSEPRLSEPGGMLESVAYVFYGRRERLQPGTLPAAADARVHAAQSLVETPLGDVNADGFGDVVLGGWEEPPASLSGGATLPAPTAFYWLPGQAQRWSGDVSLDVSATRFRAARAAGDLDGDGVSDVLLYDDDRIPHLFYGGAGLFENGVDFAEAAASFPALGLDGTHTLRTLHDLDGDGDDELVLTEVVGANGFDTQQVALLSGTSVRRSGEVQLAMSGWKRAPDENLSAPELLEGVFPAGDLDGDGAADVITWSGYYGGGLRPDGPTDDWDVPSLHLNRTDDHTGQMSVHYGKPGVSKSPLR